jgi:TnpA family transposase
VTSADIQQSAAWSRHEEALRAARAAIVHAMAALDTTHVWGAGRASSSEGHRLRFPRRVRRRTSRPRLGDYAVEVSPFMANHYAPCSTVPSECTAREAPYVLDGLRYQESALDPEEHDTEPQGDVEWHFAAFPRFGKRCCPRLRGVQRHWISRRDRAKADGPLTTLRRPQQRRWHLDWSTAHGDRRGPFVASGAAGHTPASGALTRLLACGPRHHFSRAVRELGRLYKPGFLLDSLTEPALRRRVRRGLLQGEPWHALARQVHEGKRGQAAGREVQQQRSRASCVGLILAAIISWQRLEIDRVLRPGDPTEDGRAPALLTPMSPMGGDNLVLLWPIRPCPGLRGPLSALWAGAQCGKLRVECPYRVERWGIPP